MGVLTPETWFVNKTENTMVLVTEDEFGVHVGTESIEPGLHLNMGYRKGIDRIGKIHFWVHPKNRPDLRGPNIMPIDVYDYADIDVVYKLGGSVSGRYRIGALVGFEFKRGTTFGRIGLVRWCDGACASLASLGNCHHAPPTPATAPPPPPVAVLHAIGHVQALAPALSVVVAQVPDPSPEIETAINGNCYHAPPTPATPPPPPPVPVLHAIGHGQALAPALPVAVAQVPDPSPEIETAINASEQAQVSAPIPHSEIQVVVSQLT